MLQCPHCGSHVVLAKLQHPSFWAGYRLCPTCSEKFTVDSKTKVRQSIAILASLVALLLTGLMYFQGTRWLFPSILSYTLLAAIIWWGNRHVRLVPYRPRRSPPYE